MHLDKTGSRAIGFTIFRLLVCFLIIRNLMMALPLSSLIYGNNAIEPFSRYEHTLHNLGLDFLSFTFDMTDPAYYLWMLIGAAFLYGLGIGKWFVGLLVYALLLNLQWRNPMVLSGADNVILVCLPFLILGDSYRILSYNWPSFSFEKSENARFVRRLAALGLMLQVCIIYFVTGIEKAAVDLWQDGIANYYILQLHEFEATKWNVLLAKNPVFVKVTTYLTLVFEIFFPLAILFKKPKYAWLAMGLAFHLGIWFFMRIDVFPWIMISTYFVFFSDKEYKIAIGWMQEKSGFSFSTVKKEAA